MFMMNCVHLERGDTEKGLPEKIYGTGTCLWPEKGSPYLRVSTEAIGRLVDQARGGSGGPEVGGEER